MRFGLCVGCRLANYARIESPGGESKELNPVGRREDLRKQRTLLRNGPESSNGCRARIDLHHAAMMLSTAPAARRKLRFRSGKNHGCGGQQAEQTQQHGCNRSSHICILPLGYARSYRSGPSSVVAMPSPVFSFSSPKLENLSRVSKAVFGLMRPDHEGDYRSFQERLRTLDTRQLLCSQWALRTTYTASELKKILKASIHLGDRILVSEVGAEWTSRRALSNRAEI